MKSRRTTLLPLVLAIALTGCGYNQVQAQNATPIPQSLIMAAERASHSSMALADIMARAHGQSVRDIELEVPDAHVPDFLLQRVRLDYNGPMGQVLQRISTDIGYRVAEYNEPSSGRSWEPWIRLHGDKPLVQHFKEMNSQTPWHLVLDHVNRRIVVDYDADGSMANQVQRAQRALNSDRINTQARLPDTQSIQLNADRQVSNDVIPAPESSARQAQIASAPTTTQPPMPLPSNNNALPVEGRGYWYAGITGYQTQARAEDMRTWLGANEFEALVKAAGGGFEVHVPAIDDQQAASIRQQLSGLGVPSTVNYHSGTARQVQSTFTSTSSGRNPYPASTTAETNTRTAAPTTADLIASKWYVQIAYTISESGARSLANSQKLRDLPLNAYRLGRGWAVRLGPYDSRSEALVVMKEARGTGYADAYPVQGSNA